MPNCNDTCTPAPVDGVIPPFWGFTAFTPTIPKLYWDVKSQEQRILNLFDLLNKLVCYADTMGIQISANAANIAQLQAEFENLKEGGLLDYYEQQLTAWINANMEELISQAIKMVFFGLTQDGYFCAYIPSSWKGIEFDTIMDYASPNYGCLTLSY